MRGSETSGKKPFKEVEKLRTRKPKLERVSSKLTKHKNADEKLYKVRADWEKTFDAISDWIVLIDLKSRILRTNRSGEDFIGISSAQIVGQSCCKLVHGSEEYIPGCPLQKMLHSRQREKAELKVPDTYRWLLVTVDPVIDKEGNLIGAVHITHDITERKQAEEALRESEERFRILFEQAADSIVLIDGDTGELLEFNDKAHENLGYTREEFRKLKISDFEVIESTEEVAKHIEKIIRNGRDTFETKHRTKDGRIRDIKVSSRAISISGRNFCQSIWRDITERKAAEDKLLEYQEKLKKMSAKLLSTEERERHRIAVGFHDNIAQELVIVKMSIESSLKLVSDPNALGSLRIATEAIGDMICRTELLIYELNNPILHELGLTEAIKSYCTKEVRQKHGIAFELEADERLKIPNEEVRNCLFRVTRELLINVIKHAHAHKVKVSVQKSRNQIHISVQDDGKGFIESEAGARKSRTTRFGLFSIREQLGYLGGHLEIESEPGQGTTATVVVPLRDKATV